MKSDNISIAAGGGTAITELLSKLKAKVVVVLRPLISKLSQRVDEAEKLRAAIGEPVGHETGIAAQADAVVVAGRGRFVRLQEDVVCARRVLVAFQMRHGLMRPPVRVSPVMGVLVLGVMVFVEALLNAAFIQGAHMTATPIAALMLSVLISATNILASCCAGFFIGRWLCFGVHAVDPDEAEFRQVRFRARFLHWVFIAVIGFFHLTVGLVRTQETITDIEHSLAAYVALLHTPEALFLVITGICLSVIAWHKSLSAFSDPYPQYSAHQRALSDAEEALLDLQDELSAEISELSDEAIDEAEKAQTQHRKAVLAYNKKVELCSLDYRALEKAVGQAEGELVSKTAQLLDTFRVSGGEIDPAFDFDTHYSFQDMLSVQLPEFLPPPSPSSQVTHLNEAKAKHLAQLGQLFSDLSEGKIGDQS